MEIPNRVFVGGVAYDVSYPIPIVFFLNLYAYLCNGISINKISDNHIFLFLNSSHIISYSNYLS